MTLSVEMTEALNERFRWRRTNVSALENPILVVLDYSPGDDQRLLSIAFDLSGGPKCWLTESHVREIGGKGPNPHLDYKKFVFEGREFYPYSIVAFPQTIFQEIREFAAACRCLYGHINWR